MACVSPSGSVTPENPHHETELKTRHRREKLLLEKMDKCFDRLSFCTDDPAFDLVS